MSTSKNQPAQAKAGLPLAARLYIRPLQIVGLGVLGYALWQALEQGDIRWLYLVILTGAASFLSVQVSASEKKSGSVTVSPADFFIFAAIVLVGPAAGALMGAVEGLVSSWRVKVRSLNKVLFNISQLAVGAYLVGTLLTRLLPDVSSLVQIQQGSLAVLLISLLEGALVYFLLNSLLVATAMALVSGRSLADVAGKGFLWALLNNCVNACLVVVVLALAGPITMRLSLALVPLIVTAYLLKAITPGDRREAKGGLFSLGFFTLPTKARGYLLAVAVVALPLYVYCPSIIAVVSISEYLIRTAKSVRILPTCSSAGEKVTGIVGTVPGSAEATFAIALGAPTTRAPIARSGLEQSSGRSPWIRIFAMVLSPRLKSGMS